MIQYLVTTNKGKIVASTPNLPIIAEDLEWINSSTHAMNLAEALHTKMPILHCEITAIDWDTDTVNHIVVS